MKRSLCLLGVLILGLVFTAASQADMRFGRHKGHGKPGGEIRGEIINCLTQLNLSDAQKHDIALILKQHRDENGQAAKDLANARVRLLQMVAADEPNEASIRAASQQVAGYEEERAVRWARVLSDVKNVLTPEQLNILSDLKTDLSQKIPAHVDARLARLDHWIEVHGK